LTAAVFRAVRNPSKLNIGCLSAAILLPSVIRPTGLSVYFLAIVFAIYFYKKSGARKLLPFVLPILLLSLAWASWNYCISGVFLPGNFKRVITAAHISASPLYLEPKYENVRDKNGVVPENDFDSLTVKTRIQAYMHQITEKVPNFYSSLMPTRIRRFYIYNLPSIPQLNYMYDGKLLIPQQVKKYTYRNYLSMPQKNEVSSMMQQLNFENCKRNPCILLYSVLNKFENVLIRTKLSWLLIFFSLIACIGLSFSSFMESKKFIVFLIPVLMLLSSIIVAASFANFQYRYGHVMLFIVYLMPCLYAMLLSGGYEKSDFLKK
jgi:hypothetical protein